MRGSILLFIYLFLSIFSYGADSDFPAKPNPPRLINDFAGMLNASEIAELEHKVNVFNDSTSIEISVVIITNLGDYDISDYAARLGDYWGIGKNSKDNGVLLLIAKENRKAFIATGYGMEGVLPDMRCKRIIEADLIPQFKRSDYYSGIDFTIDAIMRYSKGEYTADPNDVASQGRVKPAYVFLFIFLIIIIFGYFNRHNNSGNNGNRRGGGGFGMFPPLGGFGGGGGGFGGGSSGGGGFGGFGGGGFGGGGSGGSW